MWNFFNKKKGQAFIEYILIAAFVGLILVGASTDLIKGAKTNFYYGLLPTNEQKIDLPPPPEGVPTVSSKAPIAKISGPTKVHVGEWVTFTNQSQDSDGRIVRTDWGGNTLKKQFLEEGEHSVTLTVWDNDGLTNTTTHTFYVGNAPPIASISIDPNRDILWKENLTISAIKSSDPDGDKITEWRWYLDGVEQNWVYDGHSQQFPEGKHTIGLKVKDILGKWSDLATKTINIIPNHKPIAVITYNPQTELTDKTNITWSSSSSYDIDKDKIIKEEWINKKTTYPVGEHIIKLRVQDEWGKWSDWSSTTITISRSNRPPIAVITVSPIEDSKKPYYENTKFTWSYSNSTDPDNDKIIAHQWQNAQQTYKAGTYTIQLRVQDEHGLWSSWVSKTIKIEPCTIINTNKEEKVNQYYVGGGRTTSTTYNVPTNTKNVILSVVLEGDFYSGHGEYASLYVNNHYLGRYATGHGTSDPFGNWDVTSYISNNQLNLEVRTNSNVGYSSSVYWTVKTTQEQQLCGCTSVFKKEQQISYIYNASNSTYRTTNASVPYGTITKATLSLYPDGDFYSSSEYLYGYIDGDQITGPIRNGHYTGSLAGTWDITSYVQNKNTIELKNYFGSGVGAGEVKWVIDYEYQSISGDCFNNVSSCSAIKQNNPSATNGYYNIKPTNYLGEPFRVYCDMTNGGWIRVRPTSKQAYGWGRDGDVYEGIIEYELNNTQIEAIKSSSNSFKQNIQYGYEDDDPGYIRVYTSDGNYYTDSNYYDGYTIYSQNITTKSKWPAKSILTSDCNGHTYERCYWDIQDAWAK